MVLEDGRWDEFLKVGERFGFRGRVSNPAGFARRTRVLLVRHEPSGLDVDVVVAGLPFEKELLERGATVVVGGVSTPVCSAEDLIILKAVAGRARDWGDIEGVLDANPGLDRERVRRWVEQFAAALEAPEIMEHIEKLLALRPT